MVRYCLYVYIFLKYFSYTFRIDILRNTWIRQLNVGFLCECFGGKRLQKNAGAPAPLISLKYDLKYIRGLLDLIVREHTMGSER